MAKTINLISIADNAISQAYGLQHVRHLAADHGMLFKFNNPRVLSFWMKDTYLQLEIAFIDHDGIVVKTERMVPMSTKSVTSGKPCIMALEVPAGTFDKFSIIGKKANIDIEKKLVTFDD